MGPEARLQIVHNILQALCYLYQQRDKAQRRQDVLRIQSIDMQIADQLKFMRERIYTAQEGQARAE